MSTIKNSVASQPTGFRDLSKVDSQFTKQWAWVRSSPSLPMAIVRGIAVELQTVGYALGNLISLGWRDSQESFFKKGLSDLKIAIGISDSDLNRKQLTKIFNISEQRFSSDSTRIKNLNRVLTNTEESLSKGAHEISKAKGKEDRYFHAEGCKFAQENAGSSTADFIKAKRSLVNAVAEEVKATEKYTIQNGNSVSSISRREYLVDGILKFARENGLVEEFILSAIEERDSNPNQKIANEQFIGALREGIAHELLSVEEPRFSAALENIARTAMHQVEQRNKTVGFFGSKTNPDEIVLELGKAFKSAGMLPNEDLSQFVYNVQHGVLITDEAKLPEMTTEKRASQETPVAPAASNDNNVAVKKPSVVQLGEFRTEDSVSDTSDPVATESTAVETVELPVDISGYIGQLKSLTAAQKKLLDDLSVLKTLLKLKAGDDLKDLGTEELRAMIEVSRSLGLPVSADRTKPADLDRSIQTTEASIARQMSLIETLSQDCPLNFKDCPADYAKASKESKEEASALRKEIRVNAKHVEHEQGRIVHWRGQVAKVEDGINSAVQQGIPLAVGGPDESILPQLTVPQAPKPEKSGFFSSLFSKTKATDESKKADEELLPELEATDLPEPVVANNRGWFSFS